MNRVRETDLDRLPFVFQTHTGSPTGYAETAAVMMRAFWEEGLEVRYLYVADDAMYEETSMDPMVDAMRSIEPEPGLPHIVYSIAPIFWHNSGKYKIGWTMMEVDGINDRWVRACNFMDEIWVPTPMNKEAFEASGVKVPIYVVPLCIDERKFQPNLTAAFYHGEAKFRFFAMGWWQLRKRWDILLHAFADEFGGDKDVGLVIKTLSMESEESILDQVLGYVGRQYADQVAVISGPLPWWELAMIMRSMHAFVLPTSGEGWGCPPQQALAVGMPVIITDCMGPGEVLRDDSGKPYPGVRFLPASKECTKVTHPYYEGKNWWVVDEADLRKAMREVREDYRWWRLQAACGSEIVRERLGSVACAKRVRDELSRVYREVLK